MIGLYRHFKGALYFATAIARHSETQAEHVVYRTLYDSPAGKWWIRPRAAFEERIERDGSSVPRFERLGTLRKARATDLRSIYLLGFDAWGDGAPLEEYLSICAASTKYRRGTWHVLEDPAGKIVSAAIAYPLADGMVGLGSICTDPAARGRGYGGALVQGLMGWLEESEEARAFLLFSDIRPEFYAKFGFKVLPEEMQRHPPSVTMLRCPPDFQIMAALREAVAHYF